MHTFCPFSCDTQSAYTIYDTIESVKNIWDNLLPQNHHLQSGHLQLIENTQPAHIQFKYLIIQDEKLNNIGCAYLQLLNFNANHYNNDILKKPSLAHIKNHILKQNTNLLFCGNLFRINFQGFYFLNENNNHLLLPVLKHFAKKNPYKINFTGVMVKDCLVPMDETTLNSSRYKQFPNDISMQMTLRSSWKCYDDYKTDLSRKYLQRANKIRKAREALTVRELLLNEVIEKADLLEKLYLNIAQKQAIKMGMLNANYFVEMLKTLGNKFKVFGYFVDETLVAFTSYIVEENTLEIHYIGIDYQYNEQYKLYFNILFDGLEMAILTQKPTLILGRTAREAKASLGANAVLINNYIWVKLGLPTLIYNYFYKWYNAHQTDEWKNRYPFR